MIVEREQAYCIKENLTQEDLIRIKQTFDLMNLTKEQRERYLTAGKIRCNEKTKKEEILYPDDILRNGCILDYAKTLLSVKNPQVVEKGYQLLELLNPLAERKKTKKELQAAGKYTDLRIVSGRRFSRHI
ncbi:hypothetical protein NIA71_18735 [Ihubacter massiliensis]|uniref:Uncharacterized protein n=1 Tax=Hominibacterium faecale TaxID=2839743 RepID=A0A9J6QSG2_9FIRM|nr:MULTISPECIES: hypothetical protein [Eubacteriales Family XIII. Incertae Sedis]MCI7300981.1 hypothetical protein [Clostridia bacterium]MCO7123966.1 hypothetical protein [Ihubacter massiliensis]MCU7378957.1 hypothetical protein [Hominibacterium faecale]MDY3011265.1 hypothetical protein [Clostridiales Family XIII bacterium]